jgi:hypothetical protein
LVGPDCRIFLGKYDGISEIILLGMIEAGHSPEEATALVERHVRDHWPDHAPGRGQRPKQEGC